MEELLLNKIAQFIIFTKQYRTYVCTYVSIENHKDK
jgi:hypothetical protein